MFDQLSALRNLASRNLASQNLASRERNSSNVCNMRVLVVTSGKGGVGKTNFTVNLAVALAEYGQRVIIFDGDLGLANVDISFGLTARYTIEHLLSGEKTIEQILLNGPRGIRIIPGGSGIQELANLERNELANVIANFVKLEKMTDLLLIDTGAGLGYMVINFLRAADDIILLTTPEPTALIDAYGLLKTVRKEVGAVPINVVINRVQSQTEAQAMFKRLEMAAHKFLDGSLCMLGWVYDDPHVRYSVMQQEPLGISFSNSPAYKCIQWIAGTVNGIYHDPPRKAGGVRGFLSKLLRSF